MDVPFTDLAARRLSRRQALARSGCGFTAEPREPCSGLLRAQRHSPISQWLPCGARVRRQSCTSLRCGRRAGGARPSGSTCSRDAEPDRGSRSPGRISHSRRRKRWAAEAARRLRASSPACARRERAQLIRCRRRVRGRRRRSRPGSSSTRGSFVDALGPRDARHVARKRVAPQTVEHWGGPPSAAPGVPRPNADAFCRGRGWQTHRIPILRDFRSDLPQTTRKKDASSSASAKSVEPLIRAMPTVTTIARRRPAPHTSLAGPTAQKPRTRKEPHTPLGVLSVLGGVDGSRRSGGPRRGEGLLRAAWPPRAIIAAAALNTCDGVTAATTTAITFVDRTANTVARWNAASPASVCFLRSRRLLACGAGSA